MRLLSFFPLIMLERGISAMIRPGPFEIGLVTIGLVVISISVIVWIVVRLIGGSP